MDIARAVCANCSHPMQISKLVCHDCELALEGQFDLSPLAMLAPEDQVFVTAFVRSHGSIKKMEERFGISYPTVKNRLNAIGDALERSHSAPPESPAPSLNARILEQLERGTISVDEAIGRMR